MRWLQEIFCGELKVKLIRAQNTIENLENTLSTLESFLQESNKQYVSYKQSMLPK